MYMHIYIHIHTDDVSRFYRSLGSSRTSPSHRQPATALPSGIALPAGSVGWGNC